MLIHRPRFTRSASLLGLVLFGATWLAADDPGSPQAQEQKWIAVLRSDTPAAEKAMVCKKLAIDGSDASVGDLAKLLSDPQLASWARIALEAIPGETVDQALLAATDELDGLLLVGVINSIGVRRDANAVAKLTSHLDDDDKEVVAAAAVALGRIGDSDAARSLRQAFANAAADVRSAIAEGCVLCAERLLAANETSESIKMFDEVRVADVAGQRILEATRGAILARQQDGLALLIEQFQSPEKPLFQLALSIAREFPGDQIDSIIAAEMVNATPDRAALMIQAMADRPRTVVLSAILNAATGGDQEVRLSAIDALKRVGDPSCLDALLKIATQSDLELAEAAKDTLAKLPGERVDSQVVSRLAAADRSTYLLLIELIGKRRIDAVDQLLVAAKMPEAQVRHAAMLSLGETISLKRLPILITQVTSAQGESDARVAKQALRSASVRMADREACAAELSAAIDRSDAATTTHLLEILSEVGGATALQTLAISAKSDDPQRQDTASRLLGKWNGLDAAPVLLDLATSAPGLKYQIRALRGYVGLTRKFAMPDRKRAEMCRQAMSLAKQRAEQQLVLDVLQLHPSLPTLSVALEAMNSSAVQSEAKQAALVIAQKLKSNGVDVTDRLSQAGL